MYSINSGESYIKSRPHPVILAGFESTTLKLQQNGWQLAIMHYPDLDGISLTIHHPNAKLYGISNKVSRYDFMRRFDKYAYQDLNSSISPFYIQQLSSDIQFNIIPTYGELGRISAIDARPELASIENVRLSEMDVFKTIMDSEEIIVDPNDVPELMEKILKAQEPKQQEIRQRIRKENERRDIRQSNKLHAQIISLVG